MAANSERLLFYKHVLLLLTLNIFSYTRLSFKELQNKAAGKSLAAKSVNRLWNKAFQFNSMELPTSLFPEDVFSTSSLLVPIVFFVPLPTHFLLFPVQLFGTVWSFHWRIWPRLEQSPSYLNLSRNLHVWLLYPAIITSNVILNTSR